MKHMLNWKVGFCDSASLRPKETFKAEVPGAVQLDYAKYHNLPDYRKGTNYKQYKWMEDKFCVYSAEFDASNIPKNMNIFLKVKGIDYKYEIFANAESLCAYEGMYGTHRLYLNKCKGSKIKLEIVIYPIPKSTLPGVHPNTREEANQCCKPAVSYEWDFHPRLVPIGIWEEIYIDETTEETELIPEISYELSEDLSSANVSLSASGPKDIFWELKDPDGKTVFNGTGQRTEFTLNGVRLWWCNGYGRQELYSLKVTTRGNQIITQKIGFKKIELVKAEGSWNETSDFPATRNTPPITVSLNNQVIFVKGSNWVCPEIFYGTLNYDRYRTQLELVKKANLNFLRCWGGAVVNKDSFFEICDELGILVWQEFPLACNCYYGTKQYISVFEKEALAIIERVKDHVCLMLLCGGNELFNGWSRMTDQDKVIRLINKITYEKIPAIPFIPTSPLMGMVHGPYTFNSIEDGREIIEVIAQSHNTAYTEFGGGGFSTIETLQMIGTKEELWPLYLENQIAVEHGIHWSSQKIERYFGKIDNFEDMIQCGQFIQSVGIQFVFEEARRQKPYCSMVSNWCFNEPWPNTGNHSIVSYPNYLKPSYYSVKNACRSVLASARYRKLVYVGNETLDFDLFLLNDSLEKVDNGTVHVFVQIGDGERTHLLDWDYCDIAICSNREGPTVRYRLPVVENASTLKIILECGEYSSKYTLLYRLSDDIVDIPKKMNTILSAMDSFNN